MKSEKTRLEAVKSCVFNNNYDSLQELPKDFKISLKFGLWEFGYTLEDLKIKDTENIIDNLIFAYCPRDFGITPTLKCPLGSCTECWNTKL